MGVVHDYMVYWFYSPFAILLLYFFIKTGQSRANAMSTPWQTETKTPTLTIM